MRSLLFTMTLLAVVACKDDSDPTDIPAADKTMKVTIDGQERISSQAAASISSPAGETLQIEAGFSPALLYINIYSNNILNPIVAGEYKFDGSQASSIPVANCFYSLNNSSAPYASVFMQQTDVGKVTITELDRVGKTVSGTFDARVGKNNEVVKFEKGSFTKVPLTIN